MMGGMGSPGTVALISDDLMFASQLRTTMRRAGGSAVMVSGDAVPDVALVFISGSAVGFPEGLDANRVRWVRKPFDVAEIVAAITQTRAMGRTELGRSDGADEEPPTRP